MPRKAKNREPIILKKSGATLAKQIAALENKTVDSRNQVTSC